MASDLAVKFLVAAPSRVGDVLAVLDEAAAWLQGRGVEQWPDLSDPVWDGVPGAAALYVHRVAVRRSASGLGAVILRWAADVARQQGRKALRLDCVASNSRLRAYYAAAGFAHRGDATVAGAPGQRLGDGPVTVVSRYEQRLNCRR